LRSVRHTLSVSTPVVLSGSKAVATQVVATQVVATQVVATS